MVGYRGLSFDPEAMNPSGGSAGIAFAPQKSSGQYQAGPSTPIGYGGFDYSTPTFSKGYPTEMLPGFGQIAGYIGQGSAGAEKNLRQGYEDAFRQRVEGISAGRNEQQRRLSGDVQAQGYSPEMLRRLMFSLGAQDQASIGEAKAQSDAGLHQQLADLIKGTGTELAGLKQSEMAQLIQALMQYKARASARAAGKNQLLGQLVGIGGDIFAPGLGTAFSSFLNSGGGGGGGVAPGFGAGAGSTDSLRLPR